MDEQQVDPKREGVSSAAWAALGAIGAAVVAGVVTLVTVYFPASPPAAAPIAAASSGITQSRVPTAPTAASALETSAPPPAPPVPRSALLNDFTGQWRGTVSAGGQTFAMTLDIPDTCSEGMPCGTITTDLYGCVGELVLVRINDGPQFDLATVDFHDGSSPSCELRPGGGDYFTMGRDVLVYAAGYDGSRHGTLRRVG